DVMLFPTGYNSDQPSSEKFCDYDQCSILSDTESSRQVLICGHAYHNRLSKGISEDLLILEEEDDRITDEDNNMFEDEI
ncbi:13355_t:CDS:2, partial [Funneliformis geosporum]